MQTKSNHVLPKLKVQLCFRPTQTVSDCLAPMGFIGPAVSVKGAHMIKEAMALDAGDSVDVVAIVYGSVAELRLHVSQLGTQLRREGGGREEGKWATITLN